MTVPDLSTQRSESLAIIYEDDFLIAVHKPAGLLVHKSPIDRHETRYALQIVRNQIGRWVYPIHRLDKPTSGLLLLAKRAETAGKVAEQFENGKVRKTYLAVVRGYPPLGGVIRHAIREDAPFRHQKPSYQDKPAQEALTVFHRLAQVELPFKVEKYPQSRYSLLRVRPCTGRRHQIRRHLKHISHPIIGDANHGRGRHNRFFQNQFDCHRLLLAATDLTLEHPVTGEPLALHCPLADDFLDLLRCLGWNAPTG